MHRFNSLNVGVIVATGRKHSFKEIIKMVSVMFFPFQFLIYLCQNLYHIFLLFLSFLLFLLSQILINIHIVFFFRLLKSLITLATLFVQFHDYIFIFFLEFTANKFNFSWTFITEYELKRFMISSFE